MQKHDSPSTKKLCIITLARIFTLTHEHQSLVREITTPSLPGFIMACLNLTKISRSSVAVQESDVQSPLLLVVLNALSELIAMHPTSFRPFVPQIRSLTHLLLAPAPSNLEDGNHPSFSSAPVSESARKLFVLLHVSGPKNTAGEEWAKSLDALMVSIQRTADRVFRLSIEDWTSSIRNYDVAISNQVEDVVSDKMPTPLALPGWTGIHAGIERFDGLLQTLQVFLASATAAAVTVPVGHILNLIERVFSIFPPGNGRNPRVKPEIGKDEREGLWDRLPRLQISAIGVSSLMISRMGHSSAAIASTILEQLLWALESQYGNDDFRSASYGLVSQILTAFGPSLPRNYASSLSRCIKMCCEDLVPSTVSQSQSGQASVSETKKPPNGSTSTNADSYLRSATNQEDSSAASTNVLEVARGLLPLTLTNLPNEYLPFSLRCQIDRTAIITNDKKAILASVMNPTSKRKGKKQTSSILPLLARAHPEALDVETLLRPQMPPIQYPRSDEREGDFEEEEDTYMHDHPHNGEPEDFYHDLVGTNENANVEKTITTVEQNTLQKDTTAGAVEEGIPSIESTVSSKIPTIGLPEPRHAFSNTSTKRDREEDIAFETHEFLGGDSTEQVETKLASKRSRMGNDGIQKESLLELTPTIPVIVDTGGPVQAAKTASASDSTAVMDIQHTLEQDGSDESDFEMPVLNLDPDTDEEEEEEEEEDD